MGLFPLTLLGFESTPCKVRFNKDGTGRCKERYPLRGQVVFSPLPFLGFLLGGGDCGCQTGKLIGVWSMTDSPESYYSVNSLAAESILALRPALPFFVWCWHLPAPFGHFPALQRFLSERHYYLRFLPEFMMMQTL